MKLSLINYEWLHLFTLADMKTGSLTLCLFAKTNICDH